MAEPRSARVKSPPHNKLVLAVLKEERAANVSFDKFSQQFVEHLSLRLLRGLHVDSTSALADASHVSGIFTVQLE